MSTLVINDATNDVFNDVKCDPKNTLLNPVTNNPNIYHSHCQVSQPQPNSPEIPGKESKV